MLPCVRRSHGPWTIASLCLIALAISTATQTSVQAGQTQILARMEGATGRVETLLVRLDA